jgi:hypothetical protein
LRPDRADTEQIFQKSLSNEVTQVLTVAFAFLVATGLFLAFRQTRALGVIGVFVLLCIDPVVFGSLLVLGGVLYWLFSSSRRQEFIPKGNLLPPNHSRRRAGAGLLVLLALVGGVLAIGDTSPPAEPVGYSAVEQGETRSAPVEEVVLLRTPGGLLETARIEAQEVLDATITHSLLGVEVGDVEPRIRVTATYRYAVPLSKEWSVVNRGGVITAMAPQILPSLPVAIDTATIEKSVASGTWLLVPFMGDADLELLERSITEKLGQKSLGYRERAVEESRKTIAEFVRTWAAQAGCRDVRSVRVVFEGEPIRNLDAFAG